MSQQIYIGSIVEVRDKDHAFYGQQGQVVAFDTNNKHKPVRVWFGHEIDYLIDYPYRLHVKEDTRYSVEPPLQDNMEESFRIWNFAPDHLITLSTWSMKTLVERHFKHTCTRYCEPTTLFVAGSTDCDVEGCSNTAIRRIIYNVWGSVCCADVCGSCAQKYDCKALDEFPRKTRQSASKAS